MKFVSLILFGALCYTSAQSSSLECESFYNEYCTTIDPAKCELLKVIYRCDVDALKSTDNPANTAKPGSNVASERNPIQGNGQNNTDQWNGQSDVLNDANTREQEVGFKNGQSGQNGDDGRKGGNGERGGNGENCGIGQFCNGGHGGKGGNGNGNGDGGDGGHGGTGWFGTGGRGGQGGIGKKGGSGGHGGWSWFGAGGDGGDAGESRGKP